jgi:hypothetical protein
MAKKSLRKQQPTERKAGHNPRARLGYRHEFKLVAVGNAMGSPVETRKRFVEPRSKLDRILPISEDPIN